MNQGASICYIFARRQVWADPDDTLHGDPGALATDMGVGCRAIVTNTVYHRV